MPALAQTRFEHEALYYDGLDEFLTGTTRFVDEGLAQNQPVLIAVPEPGLSALREHYPGRRDLISFVDMKQIGRNPNAILAYEYAFGLRHRPQPVRVIGEPAYAGRTPEELALAVQHEALANVAFAGSGAHALCPYDVAALPHAIADADRTHPVIVTAGGRRVSDRYTDPYVVLASCNQPLPQRLIVDDVVVFEASQLSGVRARVAKHALAAGLDPERVEDLRLAVSEICANAVTHGGVRLAVLRMWADDDRVVYEVRGGGHITDAMAGRLVPPLLATGGRGLLIANLLCDLVQTYTAPGGTTTRLHMRL